MIHSIWNSAKQYVLLSANVARSIWCVAKCKVLLVVCVTWSKCMMFFFFSKKKKGSQGGPLPNAMFYVLHRALIQTVCFNFEKIPTSSKNFPTGEILLCRQWNANWTLCCSFDLRTYHLALGVLRSAKCLHSTWHLAPPKNNVSEKEQQQINLHWNTPKILFLFICFCFERFKNWKYLKTSQMADGRLAESCPKPRLRLASAWRQGACKNIHYVFCFELISILRDIFVVLKENIFSVT